MLQLKILSRPSGMRACVPIHSPAAVCISVDLGQLRNCFTLKSDICKSTSTIFGKVIQWQNWETPGLTVEI